MSSFLDKYKVGKTSYLVYYHKGQIKVKEGYSGGMIFYPKDVNTWMSKCPARFMEINSRGKVLVSCKEDIPKARQMIIEHYRNKITEYQDSANRTIRNIGKMIEAQK